MKSLWLITISALMTVSAFAQVGELDPQVAPEQIIVRVDANGNSDVFKVATQANVQDENSAVAAIENFATENNKITTVVPQSELDQVSSTESWYFYYQPYYRTYGYNYNYGYSYNYYGYNYNYRPYYNYNYGYYNYYYYYRY